MLMLWKKALIRLGMWALLNIFAAYIFYIILNLVRGHVNIDILEYVKFALFLFLALSLGLSYGFIVHKHFEKILDESAERREQKRRLKRHRKMLFPDD